MGVIFDVRSDEIVVAVLWLTCARRRGHRTLVSKPPRCSVRRSSRGTRRRATRVRQSHQRNVTGESTFLLDRQFTRNWGGFVEYVGDFPESGGNRQLLHFGTAVRLTNNEQLDFHVGVGLTAAAADHFVGLGYSFRFFAK